MELNIRGHRYKHFKNQAYEKTGQRNTNLRNLTLADRHDKLLSDRKLLPQVGSPHHPDICHAYHWTTRTPRRASNSGL